MNSEVVTRQSVSIAGTEISFETGKLARQASGAVVVRAGDTMVLCTATAGNVRDVDFLPLTVDIEERMYAAGKIPGSFFKREGRAGEKATLSARLIDRPIRPLFPKGWRFETQLVAIPISVDHVNPYDILAMNGASAALMVSNIPFPTPVGAVRIGKVDGNFVVNPAEDDLVDNTDLDLIVAGTEEAILMVEAGANEIPEPEILDALDIAHEEIKKLCAVQRQLAEQGGKEKTAVQEPQVDPDLYEQISSSHGPALDAATQVEDKLERQEASKLVEEQVLGQYAGDPESEDYPLRRVAVQLAFDRLEKSLIRERIAVQKKRPDGRTSDEIRPIAIEVGVAPRTHGSALFTRGQTQALSVVALGTTREEMRLDTLGLETSKRYFHHYNFPPFSVGEAGFMRGPKRRDIGHGALAERALVPMIPTQEEFPYTIRLVSDILESNGSSSMASVCGSSLSLMDARIDCPRAELSKHAPLISSIQVDPEKIGLLIGKGGETIRALQDEFEAQIDVSDEGQVLVYASDGERGDALVERIRAMTKEVEVGDEFTGKVVKTTAFGAFVELSKGTDGLLHISNISPGERIASVEEVLNKGDELAVRVVEVDRERGRIGLRLASDPDVAGKSVEELVSVGSGDPGPPRRDRRDGRPRDGRGRDRERDRSRVRDRDPDRPRS